MRKYLYLAAAATASAAVVVLPATSALAAGHVLTITKTGGTAVKTGAVLKAGLAKGKTAVFALGTEKLTCKSASFSAKVTGNPGKPGTAAESLTSQKFSKCTVNAQRDHVQEHQGQQPAVQGDSVSDAKGFPVTVSGSSKSKPISFTVTVALGTDN